MAKIFEKKEYLQLMKSEISKNSEDMNISVITECLQNCSKCIEYVFTDKLTYKQDNMYEYFNKEEKIIIKPIIYDIINYYINHKNIEYLYLYSSNRTMYGKRDFLLGKLLNISIEYFDYYIDKYVQYISKKNSRIYLNNIFEGFGRNEEDILNKLVIIKKYTDMYSVCMRLSNIIDNKGVLKEYPDVIKYIIDNFTDNDINYNFEIKCPSILIIQIWSDIILKYPNIYVKSHAINNYAIRRLNNTVNELSDKVNKLTELVKKLSENENEK